MLSLFSLKSVGGKGKRAEKRAQKLGKIKNAGENVQREQKNTHKTEAMVLYHFTE